MVLPPRKTLGTQQASVAAAAWTPAFAGVVARKRHPVIDSEFDAAFDDLRLGQMNQRCVDHQSTRLLINTLLRRQIRHRLVGLDVLGSTIRVAAVVERIDADKEVTS